MIGNRDERLLEALNQRLKYDIYIWGHKGYRRTSGAMKSTATFKSFSAMPYYLLFLLALLLGQSHFCFGFFGIEILAIGGLESRSKGVAVGLSGYSL